jgi:GPH family glycoside/pentoside/hexuronide:cation symporter
MLEDLGLSKNSTPVIPDRLDTRTQLAYGVGELAGAVPVGAAAFLLLFFLTQVAGLDPILAGLVMFLGKIWDAINDPLVGWLSDRTRSPLGRRYPWMLGAAIPLALYCVLQWVIPPIHSQALLFCFYSAVAIFAYCSFSAMMVPYSALAAELTPDYDERTTLISFKSGFSIGGSLLAVTMADAILQRVADPHQAYLRLGMVNAIVVILAIGLCIAGTYSRYNRVQIHQPPTPHQAPSLWQQLRVVSQNRPFRYVMGLYLCAWTGVQVAAVILPFFVVHWMGLPEQSFLRMALAVQGTAVATLIFWNRLSRRTGKRMVYGLGVPLTIVGQLGLFALQPGQVQLMYFWGIVAGMGMATVYIVPWSMLPDVVDLDQLTTGQRREGIFYGFAVFLQKLGMALAMLITGSILHGAGLMVTVGETTAPLPQPASALWAIRLIFGPLPAVMLLGGLGFTYFYPITREVHAEIALKLRGK